MTQLLFAILIGLSYGISNYAIHHVREENRHYGALYTLFPALIIAVIWFVTYDLPNGAVETIDGIKKFWWLFILYSGAVFLGQHLKMKGLFYNNFQSSIILLNLGVLFSLLIESYVGITTISTGMIVGFFTLTLAALVVHTGGHIAFKITAWYIVGFTLIQAFGRNLDHWLLTTGGLGVFTVLLLQQFIMTPGIVAAKRGTLFKGLSNLRKDKWAITALTLGMVGLPASFFYVKEYGPTSILLTITSGLLIAGIIENKKSEHIPEKRLYIASGLALSAVVLSIFF